MSIAKSRLWKTYRETLIRDIQRADPSVTEFEIDEELDHIASQLTIPMAVRETTNPDIPDVTYPLYKILDMLEEDDSDTIISGNGTVVEMHKNDLSPFVNMFIRWKMERGAVKKKMFAAMDIGDEDRARYFEKVQKNLKSNKMNALYGILALVSSAFFHEYVPVAITCSARQLISASAMLFEAVIGDNCRFLSMGECIQWIHNVCENHKDDNVDAFVVIPTAEMVYDRIVSCFWEWTGDEYDFLRKYVNSLSKKERVFVYYANNMMGFIETHPVMDQYLTKMFDLLPKDITPKIDDSLWEKYGNGKELTDSNWRKMIGKELFLNPYEPPECIKECVSFVKDNIWKYCYARFQFMSVVSRMNKQRRKVVSVADTDSTMIHGEKFVEHCQSLCTKIDTGKRDQKMNGTIATMLLIHMVQPMINDTIALIYESHRVEPEYYKHMVMKNEWFYPIMLVSNVKKRYAAHALIQEGLYLPKFKADIKGFDFKKAAIPKEIQDAMIDILVQEILLADEVDVNSLVNSINALSDKIRTSIQNGSTEYWKISTYKSAAAYQHPERIQQYVGGTLWNELYPDERIESLDKVCVGKLKKDAVIRDVKCGKVIAVPMKRKEVPQEIVDQLDIDLMVYNIISAFNSVLDCFEIPTTKEKTNSGAQILKRSVISV